MQTAARRTERGGEPQARFRSCRFTSDPHLIGNVNRQDKRAWRQRDIMFMLTLCITHTVPPIRMIDATAV
jgi:hypothetical protein